MVSTSRPRRRRTIDTDTYLRGMAQLLTNGGQRVSIGTPEELAQLLALREVLDEAIVEAVRGLRDAGHTWEDIGAATGTTRQAALMKWGPKL